MSKVKIQTVLPSNYGHTVQFGTLEIKFDKLGFAEIEKEEAEKLVETYEGWLFLGEVPQKKVEKDKSADFQALYHEIETLKEKLGVREGSIKALQLECDEWKGQINKLKEDKETAVTELEGYRVQAGKQIQELELHVGLAGKNTNELVKICQSLEIPEERYKNKSKTDLITIILDESRK